MIDCETGRSTGLFFFREMGFERGGDFFGVFITYENWGNEHQCSIETIMEFNGTDHARS